PAQTESEPMDHVVEPVLEEGHQCIPRIAGRPLRLGKIAAELLLQHAVIVLHLLLLAQMDTVVGHLAATRWLHTGGGVTPLEGAFRRVAACSLEEQLHAVATAKAANGSGIPGHRSYQ